MAINKGDLHGQTVGSCILERLIGQGGMGVVYLARQARPARHVAVKVLLPNLAKDSQIYQEFLARFRREADVIARLEHVNIMPIYEYGEQDGLAYLVMPYLPGGSLRDVLSRRGPLPLNEVITYIDQAASALDYAHAQGIIHRDLKPANFLLHSDRRLVLADFGIARIMEDHKTGMTLTGTGAIVGTPDYMAPEMASGEPVDARADIYELGVVLFQMLTGRVPFSGTTPYAIVIKHLQEPLPHLQQINSSLSPAVDAVMQQATAKRREDRYPTATAMTQALRAANTTPASYPQTASYQGPTILSTSSRGPSSTAPQYSTHLPVQESSSPIPAGSTVEPVTPPSYPGYQTPPIASSPHSPLRRTQPLLIFVGILLVLLLVIGGVLVGLQLSGSKQTNNVSPGATATTSASQSTTTPQGTPTAGVTPRPTSTPIPTTQTSSVPIGASLYTAVSPGPGCDPGGGKWVNYNKAAISCQGSATQISNTSQTGNLAGIFLIGVPGQSYPSDYVVQVQLQQDLKSSTDFGVYFRNQPGNQQGVYAFLVHPNSTWSAYLYDNATGAPTEIAHGGFGDIHTAVTLDVVASGHQFTFYANGHKLGGITNTTYSSGTAGIAIDQGGTVFVSNFALYLPA